MARIIIGTEYEKEFESICALYREGFLSRANINIKNVDIDAGIITTNTNVYVLDRNAHGINGGNSDEEASAAFGRGGADWFGGFRGKEIDSSSSDWKQLISDVATQYHRAYSLIEFKQTKDVKSRNHEAEVAQRFTDKVLRRIFPHVVFSEPRRGKSEDENIYGVTLNMGISSGTGESQPIIGDVFFKRINGKLRPMRAADSEKIREFLKTAMPEATDEDTYGDVDITLVDEVWDALSQTLDDNLSDVGKTLKFTEVINYDDQDVATLKNMLDHLANNGDRHLECNSIEVLNISHVQWEHATFIVACGGRDKLRIEVGMNDVISLVCMDCERISTTGTMIEKGIVCYPDLELIEEYHDEDRILRELDPKDDDFGLTDEAVDIIRDYSECANHLVKVSCTENPRNRNCTRYACAPSLLQVEIEDGKTVYKCKNCGYPEIIYSDIFSTAAEGMYTPKLNFSPRELTLVAEETEKCRCCGRNFVKDSKRKGAKLCPMCADRSNPDAAQIRLYNRYKSMLSPLTRLKHMFTGKKFCREEDNIILFCLGNEKYVFDKLDITENGLIKPPKKYGGK